MPATLAFLRSAVTPQASRARARAPKHAFLLAAYAFKLALTRETHAEKPEGWSRELVVGALATVYTAFLLFAAGPRFMLVSFIMYAPASILFVMARREQGRRLFSPAELVILAVSVVGAVVGVVASRPAGSRSQAS